MSIGAASLLTPRVSRAELVARELEREIVDEREPGQRIGTKEDLRKRFGVAVATVNEAVRLLEVRGMIEVRPGPGGGVFAARPAARLAFSHAVLGFKRGSTSYAMVAVHRNLVKAIDAGEGPGLDAAIKAHQPTSAARRPSVKRLPRG